MSHVLKKKGRTISILIFCKDIQNDTMSASTIQGRSLHGWRFRDVLQENVVHGRGGRAAAWNRRWVWGALRSKQFLKGELLLPHVFGNGPRTSGWRRWWRTLGQRIGGLCWWWRWDIFGLCVKQKVRSQTVEFRWHAVAPKKDSDIQIENWTILFGFSQLPSKSLRPL